MMEYTNSLGYKYAEECVSCVHRNLCFQYLELAGDVTRPGQPIFTRCADIKANPKQEEEKLNKIITEWQSRIERSNGSTAHSEGGRR